MDNDANDLLVALAFAAFGLMLSSLAQPRLYSDLNALDAAAIPDGGLASSRIAPRSPAYTFLGLTRIG